MKNNNIQSINTIMKSVGKKVKSTVAYIALSLAISSSAIAQPCLVSSLNINTGTDPGTGSTVLPNGANDPKWTITFLSPDAAAVPLAGATPYNAFVVAPEPSWVTNPNSRWISFINQNNFTTNSTGSYAIKYTRCFDVCENDEFQINLRFACDDEITDIWLDGVNISAGSPGTAPSMGNFTVFTVDSRTMSLTKGQHCIVVDAMNFPYPQSTINYHGINVVGSITSTAGNATLVSESRNCEGYSCPEKDTCDDHCYWRVNGNYIHSGNNLLGTLSNDDIRILSNNTDRAILTAGGYMGIKALLPTTTFHVDCVPPAPITPSGLRFENLPAGHGNALVVDANGYVHVAQSTIYRPSDAALQDQINELKKELQEMKALLNKSNEETNKTLGSMNISPNPSNGKMNIEYNITAAYTSASIIVTDLTGKTILDKTLNSTTGRLGLSVPEHISSGDYIITLKVDGNNVSSKKHSIIK
jgi:hypothetical protein